MIYIADLQVKDNTGAAVVLRFSEKGFVTEGLTYLGRISTTAYVGQSISIDTSVGGLFTSTVGEVVLQNVDRELDYLTDYYPEGGVITLKLYEEGAALASATTVFTKYIEQFVFTRDVISIRLTDNAALLEKPLQAVKYLGDNVAPNGLEGVSDLKGKEKPLLFGRASNIEAQLVNSSKLIYQIAHNQVDYIINVMTDGAYIVPSGIAIASLAALQDDGNIPASGEFTFYSGPEGTYIRLGFILSGSKITFSGQDKITPLLNTCGQVVKRVLAYFDPTIVVEHDDITLLDNLSADTVGIYVNSSETVGSLLTQLVTSVGAYAGIDNNNKFRLYYFGNLGGTVLHTLPSTTDTTKYGITSMEIANATYNGKALPVTTVKLGYDRNYSVMDKASLAGMVVEEYATRADWLSNEYRYASTTGFSPVATAQTLEYNTALTGQVAADYESSRIVDLLSPKRYVVTCQVSIPELILKTFLPCGLLRIQYDRYSLTDDKVFVILGIEADYKWETATLTLWGPLFINTSNDTGTTLYDSNGLPLVTL
jgi:hypothetical protein